MRSYNELISFDTFEDRLRYLMLNKQVASETFGGLRGINQQFYNSYEWLSVRAYVISRDNACDLGVPGCTIQNGIYVHHMNPITPMVLRRQPELALDHRYLITTSFDTHQLIHFGIPDLVELERNTERVPHDTLLW